MADDNTSNENQGHRPRRGSFTSNTFSALFGRSNSVPGSPPASHSHPTPAAAAQPRRMSITTLGLSGNSPIQPQSPFFPRNRRESISTAGSDSIDESAIEDDEGTSHSVPTTPFARRMSFGTQAMFSGRPGGNSGSTGRTPSTSLPSIPDKASSSSAKYTQASIKLKTRTPSDFSSTRSGEGLNWSEQFRSRAESAVSRPSFSTGTNPGISKSAGAHDRAKSVSDMPVPPAASISAPAPAPAPAPARQPSTLRRKPDAVGERILRGDFYMD
jgi:hypothetical protein